MQLPIMQDINGGEYNMRNKILLFTFLAGILLFGIGTVFDSVVSLAAYCHLLKKLKINILQGGLSMRHG